jgi:hypothetical protein
LTNKEHNGKIKHNITTTLEGVIMKDTVELNYETAHNFVQKNQRFGFFWDGWDIVKWTENENGFTQKNGMFRNGKWGHSIKIRMQNNGTWAVLKRYV